MKHIYKLLIFCFTAGSFCLAQVGITTKSTTEFTPHSSSVLHLDVSNLTDGAKKGFLLPRLNLLSTADESTIDNPVIGLWVYNLATTSDLVEDRVYKWNGEIWDRYYSRDELTSFLEPNNYYLSSLLTQILTGATLTTLNNGNVIPVTWNASDVSITNDPQITRINNTEFLINKAGFYNIAGFFNYHPEILPTSFTDITFTLQVFRSAAWQNIASTTKTIESLSGDTYQSVSFPSNITSLQEGERIRFVFFKTSSNHGNNAGIKASTGIGTKSIRISYMAEVN